MSKLNPPVTANDHIEGDANAPYVLVEYGDYQCPSCGDAFTSVKHVQKHFGDKLAFVFRNFPLNEMHPHAEAAAETAEFAAAQGKFWEMHDLLFKHQENLTEDDLLGYARKLDLDPEALQQALDNGQFTDRVESDLKGGHHSGVNATPTFFINGKKYEGPYDASSLIAVIEQS